MPYGKDTEDNILNTATELFGERGKDGVSTSEIAKNAGVNKALIFYYFGSKDDLYKTALKKLLVDYIEVIKNKISSTEPGLSTIETFVREHISILRERPLIVKFLARELIKNVNEPSEALKECGEALKTLRNDLLKAIAFAKSKGEIRDIDPLQTIVNILSLNIFYFLGRPVVMMINPSADSEDFENKRVEYVLDLLINGLRKHPELQK